ncbi:putative transcriptional regulator, TetR family [Coriobacterium glomerans PW2]|uniref:Transcriptional regulator, TetR family n=1 Tax=Coriobacterium glomerans (strain ATCC 49209 / DSM 20642 / JCM 10262 / PW2) TaxID=700015 RepID=F2N753_CORGP|nr:TetR-like C-terminal domain-containing protein [Coriobacterium glomerans]AEB06392.1 putative transcriptional regulator, TetR family [Coriobacterium glomerans PW2]
MTTRESVSSTHSPEMSPKSDRRSRRSQLALRHALAAELAAGEDLSRISVAALTERAGLTRRTFYTHYRDIPDFIERLESGILEEIGRRVAALAASDLPSLYRNIDALEPAPGSVELLGYLKNNGELIGALLGPGGDPAFAQRIMSDVGEVVSKRMREGIFPGVLGTFFDYYLASVIAAEMGIIQRWFAGGLAEDPETMARIMTVIAFVRPGDLYGRPIDINVPEYGMKLIGLQRERREPEVQA